MVGELGAQLRAETFVEESLQPLQPLLNPGDHFNGMFVGRNCRRPLHASPKSGYSVHSSAASNAASDLRPVTS